MFVGLTKQSEFIIRKICLQMRNKALRLIFDKLRLNFNSMQIFGKEGEF